MQTIIPLTSHEAKEIAWPARTYVTRRGTISFDKLSEFFTESYAAIYSAINQHDIQVTEPPVAIYYSIDEVEKKTQLAAAIPVPEHAPCIVGFEYVHIPASKAVTITHYGSYDSMSETYAILGKYMAEHKLQQRWMIEEYLSDPKIEKDPTNWKTNIYFVL